MTLTPCKCYSDRRVLVILCCFLFLKYSKLRNNQSSKTPRQPNLRFLQYFHLQVVVIETHNDLHMNYYIVDNKVKIRIRG